MSGPTTVILTIEPLSVLLAGSAIHAAEAVRQGYVEAAELQAVHQEKRNFSEQLTLRSHAGQCGSVKKAELDLYTDYWLSRCGLATATGLSAMVDGAVSHDKVTR